MNTVVIVIHLMLVVAMIGVIMLQKSEGGGLGIGSTGGFMTSRGTANVLTRATAILAAGFFITSLFLSWYAGHERKPGSGLGGAGGLIEQLGGGQQQQQQQPQPQPPQPAAPTAPAAPSGPQVPQSK